MILEYKIACDNCNCIIDGIKDAFIINELSENERQHYCDNGKCGELDQCPKCGVNHDSGE